MRGFVIIFKHSVRGGGEGWGANQFYEFKRIIEQRNIELITQISFLITKYINN